MKHLTSGRLRWALAALVAFWWLPLHAQSDVVASAGDIQFSRQDVAERVAALSATQRDQLAKDPQPVEQWIRGQLAERLLLQEATAQQWEKRPDVARDIAAATNEVIARAYLQSVSQVPEGYPSDAELRAAYNRAKVNLVKPASYRLNQFFFPVPQGDDNALTQTRKKANELVQKARRPKADFVKLAEEESKGREEQTPVDTGWVTLPQLLPEVRQAVASLKAGEVSEPVQSPAGLHVLKLVEMREAQSPTLDEVREPLETRMRQERQAQIARAYLDSLANSPAVKIDNKALESVLKGDATTSPATLSGKDKAVKETKTASQP